MSKLTISDARAKELEKILKEIENEEQCPLTMTLYTVEGKSYNIAPFSKRNQLLVDARFGYEEITGVYKTHDDIKEKLISLQEQEKQNNTTDTCRRCGAKSWSYYDICPMKQPIGTMHIIPWDKLKIHSTSVGTPFAGGRMSISYTAAFITPMISQ